MKWTFAKFPHGTPATESRQHKLMGPHMSPFATHMLRIPSGAGPCFTMWLKGRDSIPASHSPCAAHTSRIAFKCLCAAVLHFCPFSSPADSAAVSENFFSLFASSQQSHQTGLYYPAWKLLLLSSRWRTEEVSVHTFLNSPQWENSMFLFQGIK